MSARTPGPWHLGDGGTHGYYLNPRIEAGEDINDPEHDSIVFDCDHAGAFSGISDASTRANAAFIVTACNAHDTITAQNRQLREALAKLEHATGMAIVERGCRVIGKVTDAQWSRIESALTVARAALAPVDGAE